MAPVATSSASSDIASKPLKENLTLKATHDHQLVLIKSEAQKPGPGQALVHVKATGVCGSDVHFWKHGCLGPWTIKDKTALGHESGGIVIAVGEGVDNVKVGDRVAIEPGVPCGKSTCKPCLTGDYNLCPTVDFYSVPELDGTLTRYHVHPAGWLHKVPDTLSYPEIACLEPLSVCLHATELVGLRLGHPVLITGAGPIGAVQLLVARAAGASPIVITDLQQDRLDFAKKLVPSVVTYKVSLEKSPEEASRDLVKLFTEAAGNTEEIRPQIAMECTGVESSVSTCAFTVNPGGKIMVIGVGKHYQTIPFMHLSTNQITLQFLFRYRDTWPKAIRLVAGGVIDVKQIVTATFPLEKAKEAVEHSADRSKFSVKTLIVDEE